MTLQELQNALDTNKTLNIRDGQVLLGLGSLDATFPSKVFMPFCGNAGIEIGDATPLQNGDPNKVVLTGKTSFLLLGLAATAQVQATFELLGNESTLGVTLRYDLPAGWRFLHSFPDLPIPFDEATQRYDYESRQSALDATFPLTGCSFYLTTHDHDHSVDGGSPVSLEKGLTFVGRCAPGGMLGFVAHIVRGGPGGLTVHGQVIPRPESGLPTPHDDGFPWDSSPRVPGIYLTAPLGYKSSFPPGSDTIQFTNLRVQTYSPLRQYGDLGAPAYPAETAYLGDVIIPAVRDTRVLTVSARVSPGRDSELVFACEFIDCTIDNIVKASESLAGGVDLHSLIPEKVRDVIGKLEPQRASITLVRPNPKSDYEVACTALTIGMAKDAKPWKLFDDLIEVGFRSVRISVVKPLDSRQRMVFLAFRGSVKFLNVNLNVTVEAPSLYCTAEQVGTATFDLQGYFSKYKLPWPTFLPPAVHLENMRLQSQPGSYYSFSMSLGTTYKIDKEYSLPTLHLAVICHTPDIGDPYLDWQFEASTKQGESVPVFLLIEKLAGALDLGVALPAAVKDLITVQSAAVAYNSKYKSFGFQCRGQLRFKNVSLGCLFTIQHTPEKLGPVFTPSETSFGGQILLAPAIGRPPLSFALQFVKSGDSKYCVAAYSNEYGYALKIRSLIECVLPESFAELIPDSLEVSLKTAFIAYSQKNQPAAGAGEPTAESDLLFGVDLGTRIKLSDLPVVGNALPKDLEFGFESLRVLLASAAFSEESVQKFNELLPFGVIPLPGSPLQGNGATGKPVVKDALGKGFSVSATLRFGRDTRTLTLPVMEESKGTAAVTGSAPIPGQPIASPTSQAVAATTKWFDIEKSLGPLTVRRIGLDYEAPRVGIKFDASLRLNVLTFNLEGLGLTYALGGSTEPSEILKNLAFTLDGMGLSLGDGPIEIGGSLVRISKNNAPLQLEGTLLIRSVPFTFSALGSYADLNGTISVAAFAVLLKELGDPTGTGAFVVTGLAFGFGVNRKLTLPLIEDVHMFPLVQAAMGKQDLLELSVLSARLRHFVTPSVGNFWVAAGIKFNSFGMIDSFLLLSVSWGAEVEIGMLGLSRMTVPPMVQPDQSIAGAELSLRGVIRIAEGLIQFEARLTDNSFLFSRNCRLTGGFAFCLWFSGPRAGDFVLSLGGYHPAFIRPAHYPLVPRLGLQLQIGAELSITGEAYFALTPFCVMAGGKLCAVYKSSWIDAWFIAYADFLMNWQPFFYQAAIGITLGVALRLGAIAIRLELSVDLKLQGPPFGGEAQVRLWIISFTIYFGAPAAKPLPLTARQFAEKCLPAPRLPALDKSPDAVTVRITGGLLREQEIKAENRTLRIVNAHQLSLVAQSVIPCTEFGGMAKGSVVKSECGILPMGRTTLHSVFTVKLDGVKSESLKVSAITGKVPEAVWGKTKTAGEVPAPQLSQAERPDGGTIEATLGIRISCVQQSPVHPLDAMAVSNFGYVRITKKVDWGEPKATTPRPIPRGGRTIFNTISSDDDAFTGGRSVVKRRQDILLYLRLQSPPNVELQKPDLAELTRNPNYFQVSQPELDSVGMDR